MDVSINCSAKVLPESIRISNTYNNETSCFAWYYLPFYRHQYVYIYRACNRFSRYAKVRVISRSKLIDYEPKQPLEIFTDLNIEYGATIQLSCIDILSQR